MKSLRPFPPPPDVELPRNRFAPIEFRRLADGSLIARLGALELGAVRPAALGCRTLAYWSSALPGGPRMRPATSIAAGRDKLAEHIRDWFCACNHSLPYLEDA